MFSHLCRACLNQFHDPSDIVPLFDAYENVFYYRICNEIHLSVKHEDELGRNICKICSKNIMKFYNFLLMYKESDKQLREMMNNRTMLVPLDTDEATENKPNVVDVDLGYTDRCGADESNTMVEFHRIKIENTTDDDVDETKQFISKVSVDVRITKQWKCTKCSSAFKTRRLLMIHRKFHLNNKTKKQWQCTSCLDNFLTRKMLQRHRREQHSHEPKLRKPQTKSVIPNWNDTDFTCDICDKQFKSKNIIKQHLATHNNENRRKFLCVTCGNQFCTKFGLNQHIRAIHDKEQRFQCAKCNRRFAHKQHLRTHMNRHEGIRPYTCNVCSKAFYDSSTLNVHTKSVHSNSNSYVCNICSKGFNRNGNLKIHMVKTHHLQQSKAQVSNIHHVTMSSSK